MPVCLNLRSLPCGTESRKFCFFRSCSRINALYSLWNFFREIILVYLHFLTVTVLLDHFAPRLAKRAVLTMLVVCHRLEIITYITPLSGLDLISVVTVFSLAILFRQIFLQTWPRVQSQNY